jgi:predicted transcriptional regulator
MGVSEMELREIFHGLRLSRRTVSLYSKSEIRALAAVAKKLR